jgi:hypothetical protein
MDVAPPPEMEEVVEDEGGVGSYFTCTLGKICFCSRRLERTVQREAPVALTRQYTRSRVTRDRDTNLERP